MSKTHIKRDFQNEEVITEERTIQQPTLEQPKVGNDSQQNQFKQRDLQHLHNKSNEREGDYSTLFF